LRITFKAGEISFLGSTPAYLSGLDNQEMTAINIMGLNSLNNKISGNLISSPMLQIVDLGQQSNVINNIFTELQNDANINDNIVVLKDSINQSILNSSVLSPCFP